MSVNVAMIEAMEAEGLSADAILRILKASAKKVDPTNAQRQARYRAKRRKPSNAVTVTPVTPPNEEDNLTPKVTPISSEIGPKPVSDKPKRGTRLPDNWELPDEWAQWARNRAGWTLADCAEEAELFRNYWTAKTGQAATSINWFRTWQNWAIRSFRKPGSATGRTGKQRSPAEYRTYCLEQAERCDKMQRRDDAAEWRRKAAATQQAA